MPELSERWYATRSGSLEQVDQYFVQQHVGFSLLFVVFINLVCRQSPENFQKDLLSYTSSSQLYLGNSICFA